MKERKGGEKEREAPTHFIENSKLTHTGCVTKNKKNLRSQSLRATAKRQRLELGELAPKRIEEGGFLLL